MTYWRMKIKPLLPKMSRQKCGIVATLVSGFIGLAYEGIWSFLQGKCDTALKKAVLVMGNELISNTINYSN